MNPLTASLKFLATSTFNIIIIFVFFLFATRLVSPEFVGEIAILQLVEVLSKSFLGIISQPVIVRDIARDLALGKRDSLSSVVLSFSVLESPLFLLFVFFMPENLWISIPYFVVFTFSTYQMAILSGLGKFDQINIGNVLILIFRWGLSLISIFLDNVALLVFFWTLGA